MPENRYQIEFLRDIEQLRQCIEIQKLAWGFADEDVLPLRALVVCTKIGGQVFGAVDAEGRVVGFLNAFPALRDGRIYLHSQMMGVRPEHQNQGIGRQLKLAQREEALKRGIDRIEWTFDPLEVRNARFNIELLGCVCSRYLVNIYGVTSSHLQAGLPTDRLVAEWYLNSPRVKQRIESGADLSAMPSPETSLEIPLDIWSLRVVEPAEALRIQLTLRAGMLELFRQNYWVTHFAIDRVAQKGSYLFQRVEDSNQLP
jgi:predicted GNAT superfamily acetyltransferase